MVSKTMLTVLLVTALAFVPSGVAMLDPTSPQPISQIEAPLDIDLDSVFATVDDVTATVDDYLSCQLLVQLPITLVYVDILDSREQHGAFLSERELENVVETFESPVYQTTTETIWGPSGLLGFLEPITKEVTTIVGYETTEITETIPVDLAVRLDWTENYKDYSDPHRIKIYLPVPAGLPYLDVGGVIRTVCEDVDVFNQVPSFDHDGHDGIAVYIGDEEMVEHLDGWYMDVFSVDVSLAEGDDFELPKRLSICTSEMAARAEAEADAYVAGLDPEVARFMADPVSYEAAQAEHAAEVQTGEAVTVPASTGAFLAIVGSIVLAAVGLVAYKRYKQE